MLVKLTGVVAPLTVVFYTSHEYERVFYLKKSHYGVKGK